MRHFCDMKNETKNATETQLLDLLKRVLPKATPDAKLAGQIYDAVALELKTNARSTAFERFCARVKLPNLDPGSIEEVKAQLAGSFRDADLTLKPNRKDKVLAVEVALPDGAQFSGEIKVDSNPVAEDSENPEFKPKFVPFPVSLPGDKELVWLLAKREDMSPEEGGIALTKIEEDFWASKTGQKLLRDRVERIFPEFMARVPAGMLSEAGLKRHYKLPEPIKVLREGNSERARVTGKRHSGSGALKGEIRGAKDAPSTKVESPRDGSEADER